MKNTHSTTYAIYPDKISLIDSSFYESQAPFWVYYNNKLACKFACRDDAQTYIKALLAS